jgi:hypothetical protein
MAGSATGLRWATVTNGFRTPRCTSLTDRPRLLNPRLPPPLLAAEPLLLRPGLSLPAVDMAGSSSASTRAPRPRPKLRLFFSAPASKGASGPALKSLAGWLGGLALCRAFGAHCLPAPAQPQQKNARKVAGNAFALTRSQSVSLLLLTFYIELLSVSQHLHPFPDVLQWDLSKRILAMCPPNAGC